MTDYLKEAQAIYDEYENRTRSQSIPFNDAVIAFLWLLARWLFNAKKAK